MSQPQQSSADGALHVPGCKPSWACFELRDMTPEHWRKITELFEAALDRPLDQRAAFLEVACAGDRELLRRVEAMLVADAREDLLIDRPAYKAADTSGPSIVSHDDSHSFSGETIGDYRLIRELGHGGMGTVYLAYD